MGVSDIPADTEADTLGSYIRSGREAAGLTPAQLAGRIGVSRQAVNQWEADEKTPSARALHFIAEQLPAISTRRLLELVPVPGGAS